MRSRSTSYSRPVKSLITGQIAIKEVSIHAPPSRVFAALTQPSKLNTWFTSGAKVDLRVGGRYSNADKDTGRFLEVVPTSDSGSPGTTGITHPEQ